MLLNSFVQLALVTAAGFTLATAEVVAQPTPIHGGPPPGDNLVVKPPVVEDPKNPPRIIFPGVEVSECKSDISKCARTTTRYESDYQYKFTTTLTSWATENVTLAERTVVKTFISVETKAPNTYGFCEDIHTIPYPGTTTIVHSVRKTTTKTFVPWTTTTTTSTTTISEDETSLCIIRPSAPPHWIKDTAIDEIPILDPNAAQKPIVDQVVNAAPVAEKVAEKVEAASNNVEQAVEVTEAHDDEDS